MNSHQTNATDEMFAANVKTSDQKASVQDQTTDTANKRYDHHLIDHDLELEDKNGRRLNPKAQKDLE